MRILSPSVIAAHFLREPGSVYAVADSGNLPARRIHKENIESLGQCFVSLSQRREDKRKILAVYVNCRRRRKQERTAWLGASQLLQKASHVSGCVLRFGPAEKIVGTEHNNDEIAA